MMRLVGSDGSLFEISVVDYEYPEIQFEEYDSNWLLIRMHVVHPRGEWTSVDPSLLTYEVEALANRFDAIAKGDHVDVVQRFTEPNLSLRLLDQHLESRLLAVYFNLENPVPWARHTVALAEDLFVEFPLSEVDLARAAEELRHELAQYPQRAAR